MPEELEETIVAWLKEHGYKDVDGNLGTIWFTGDDGATYSINATLCEG